MTTSQLTFTRFIAAFLLFVYHFREIKSGEHLNLGVSYFYVLSGFCDDFGLRKERAHFSERILYKQTC